MKELKTCSLCLEKTLQILICKECGSRCCGDCINYNICDDCREYDNMYNEE